MKTTALILGIAGSILALLLGYLSFTGGLSIAQYGAEVRTQEYTEPDPVEPSDYPLLAPGIMGIAGGAAGIAGTAFILHKKKLAVSLLAAGACLSLPSVIGIIASIPLLAGVILMSVHIYSKMSDPFKPLSITLAYCGAAMALTAAIIKYSTPDESLLIAASFAGAALSAAGGALAAKSRVIPAALLSAAAVACVIGESGILAVLLPFSAAVFALIPGKKPETLKEESI